MKKLKSGIKEATPFTIVSKIVKYLGNVNLLNEAKTRTQKNCKTLMK